MKIKELKRTVNVSWSPVEQHPALLAAGSAAQQVDASFSSTSLLELYGLNLEDPGSDLELKCSLQTPQKFQKIVWSGAGVIVGGCDGGLLQFYSAEKLLNNSNDALVSSCTKHSGHVSALDINPYQRNLVASGASESEIFIWDLNNTTTPMAPGNRSQPPDHVQGLAWNQQVQHILGSSFATRCVVWDLRKNEPIMKLSDSTSRTRWRSLAWHPSVATQLCIASEDDQAPVVQLWDLRLAASPLVTLEGHHKGVLSVSWCRDDPDMLLSAGKDGRVLCWNPNNTTPGGECLAEVWSGQQWVYDVSWCGRVPGVFAAASFDQSLSVHSLLGVSRAEQTSAAAANNIMDSFGGADTFNQLPVVARAPQPQPTTAPYFPRAPKWLRRPVRAKFGFGGKLVTFEKCPQEAGSQKLVHVSQVVSEPEIVERAAELDSVLGSSLSHDPQAAERLAEYCRSRGDACSEQHERYTWFFLRANFLPSFRSEVLNLLGFKQDDIPSRFKSSSAVIGDTHNDVAALSRGESTETEAEFSTDTSTDLSDATTLIERKLANVDLSVPVAVNNVLIPNGEDSTSLVCRALVCGNLEEAVELCLNVKRTADALIIASLGSSELLYKVQKYHLQHSAHDPVSLLAGTLLHSQWEQFVQGASVRSWRDALAHIVTHCEQDASRYCEMLGDRLSKEADPSLTEAATICYLCAMSPDALARVWAKSAGREANQLAQLVEKVLLARRAAQARGRGEQSFSKLESILNEYALRLSSQGCLQSALNSLEGVSHTELRDRLQRALHQPASTAQYVSAPQHSARTRTVSGHSQKRSHLLAHNDVSNTYSAVPPYDSASPAWPASSVPAPPASNYGYQPPPTQPPRPPSSGPGGISSRSKYKVDPSVQAAPNYNQYNFSNPITSQPQSYTGYSSVPDQYNNASVPLNPVNPPLNSNHSFNPPNSTFNPINSTINPINSTVNPINSTFNPPNSTFNPINPPAPLNPVNPAVNGGYYNAAPAPPVEASLPPPPMKPVAPGWNDPPMMTSTKPKPKQVQAQAPITHPLFGVEPSHVPLNPAAPQQYPGQQYQSQQYQAQQYPVQQSYPGQQYDQYGNPPQYPNAMSPEYPQQALSPPPPAKPPTPAPIQKGPIPEQHVVLQTIFDSLRNECASRATNQQMKRKLEDVQRRLETMYDMLREYKLSESALSSLHSCATSAHGGDYETALQVTNMLATGADFAAVASFLPALKILFQLSHQLQVCLR